MPLTFLVFSAGMLCVHFECFVASRPSVNIHSSVSIIILLGKLNIVEILWGEVGVGVGSEGNGGVSDRV